MRKRFNELSRSAQWRYLHNLSERQHSNDDRISSRTENENNLNAFNDDVVLPAEQHMEVTQRDDEIDMSNNEDRDENIDVEDENLIYYDAIDEFRQFEDDKTRAEDEVFNDEDHLLNNEDVNADDNYFYHQPIYEGAPLTVEESMILVLKHNLTDTLISDLFILISFHCLPTNLKKMSLHHFRKFFQSSSNNYVKHYYCTKCKSSLSNSREMCSRCQRHTDSHYFITLSIIEQLKLIIGRPQIYNLLTTYRFKEKQRADSKEELYDGSLYSDMYNHGFLKKPTNLSFSWFTDGVPVFKSSKSSIWPFYLRVNELPYNIRTYRENTILAGLWFGQEKPTSNHIGKSFTEELASLYNEGINITIPNVTAPVKIKAVLLSGTCDLPAKCLFLNMTQFNGKYGCPSCEYEGGRFDLPTGKSIHVKKIVLPVHFYDL